MKTYQRVCWLVAALLLVQVSSAGAATMIGPSAPAEVTVAVRSASGFTWTVGTWYLVEVRLKTPAGPAQQVGSAQAWLAFDPSYFVVVDANGNPTTSAAQGLVNGSLPLVSAAINNSTGLVKYAAGYNDPAQSSGTPFTLFRVRLKALAVTGGTPLDLVAGQTYVLDTGGNLVTVALTGATAVIRPPSTFTPTLTPSRTPMATRTPTITPTPK